MITDTRNLLHYITKFLGLPRGITPESLVDLLKDQGKVKVEELISNKLSKAAQKRISSHDGVPSKWRWTASF